MQQLCKVRMDMRSASRQDGLHHFAGQNPDFATQDLFQAIQNQTYPGWTLYAQVLTPAQAETFK